MIILRLTPVDKFTYLLSLLEPPAVAGLSLSSANYEEAVKILKKRYGNKQATISRHMDILMNIDPVGHNDTKRLRRLFDTK